MDSFYKRQHEGENSMDSASAEVFDTCLRRNDDNVNKRIIGHRTMQKGGGRE
jgi:hypothetical protein